MDKKFFNTQLLYYGLDHFYENRYIIKEAIKELTPEEFYLYQLYVYSRPFINDTWKDYIWEFLNNDIEDYILAKLYVEYKKKHRN